MQTITSKFAIGDHVWVDDDRTIKARVIAIHVSAIGQQCEVSWFNNGTLIEKYVAEMRLTLVSEAS
ncbi:hypothetical protein [Beijerinckia sp. L45]|uniref:hypothetical protein n=1 Tax=Beijerinckia sp. L45 TaxID=1641855 RepID=UPI00131E43C5|nr:hypothetical protein [Beijerinckia sp. L45]